MHTIPHGPSDRSTRRGRHRGAKPTIASLLVTLTLAAGCAGGGASENTVEGPGAAASVAASAPSTGAADTTTFAGSASGPHRYAVVHENLGSCTGAAEDGTETLDIAFTPAGLTLTNLDFDWSQEYEAVAPDRYSWSQVSGDGIEWRKQLTFTTNGFVLESETDDPAQVGEGGGLQPCFRYTYTVVD
jgi:hypothetical protein